MIVIIDYGVGNLGSIRNMVSKVGGEALVSSREDEIARATKLLLPGVGAFDAGMISLNRSGLVPLLNHLVIEERKPVLGICLGMQLMTQSSEEGDLPGLGWIAGRTKRFEFSDSQRLAIPHMGWNLLTSYRQNHPLFRDTERDQRFYFVHSYHVTCDNDEDTLATCHYGYDFACAVGHDNIMGTQFHPEKSLRFGMKLISNFVKM